jgi:AraC-like DNA-binding protein
MSGEKVDQRVVALVLSRERRARIMAGVGRAAAVCFCEQREELAALASHPSTVVVITETRDSDRAPVAPVVARLTAGPSSVPVIAYIGWPGTAPDDIVDVVRAGASDLVRAGFDDAGVAFRTALRTAVLHTTANVIKRDVEAVVPARVWPVVAYALNHADRDLTVTELACALGVHRRTVARRLRAAGVPGPRALIRWCRLILAARMLEGNVRTVESVALGLDFESAGALRNALRRYAALTVSEVRRADGFRRVAHAFASCLRARPSDHDQRAVYEAEMADFG